MFCTIVIFDQIIFQETQRCTDQNFLNDKKWKTDQYQISCDQFFLQYSLIIMHVFQIKINQNVLKCDHHRDIIPNQKLWFFGNLLNSLTGTTTDQQDRLGQIRTDHLAWPGSSQFLQCFQNIWSKGPYGLKISNPPPCKIFFKKIIHFGTWQRSFLLLLMTNSHQ